MRKERRKVGRTKHKGGGTNGRIGEWLNEGMDGWMDERMNKPR